MRKKAISQFILSILFIFAVVILIGVFSKPQAAGEFRIYFFDVGQGDASYIKTPSGNDILIDGGPDNKILSELGKVMDYSDNKIDLVVLSHPHADHLTGLIEVLSRYSIGEVWETGVEYPSATYDTWKNLIKEKNIPDKFVKEGDTKEFSNVKILIIYPLSLLEKKSIDNLNNASIINRVDYGNFSGLFTGDAEISIQEKLVDKNIFSDMLKVAHHGSENGLSDDFLKVVRPEIAVISVGKNNKFGHPALSTINLLKKYLVKIYRTDQNGTIEISSDGQNYTTKTFK